MLVLVEGGMFFWLPSAVFDKIIVGLEIWGFSAGVLAASTGCRTPVW